MSEAAMEPMVQVTDRTFEARVLRSDVPVLVDFWAEWCAPCRMLAPVVGELADAYAGRLRVAKLNVDDNAETPRRLGVRAIPTLILFVRGEATETIVGARSRSQIERVIEQYV